MVDNTVISFLDTACAMGVVELSLRNSSKPNSHINVEIHEAILADELKAAVHMHCTLSLQNLVLKSYM